jgi:hypothetical protein
MQDKLCDDSIQKEYEERYGRWQKIAIEQLGYALNLFTTLAVAELGFAVKVMIDARERLSCAASFMFHCSLALLLVTIALGLAATITRTLDFRWTRKAIRCLVEHDPVSYKTYSGRADAIGTYTWGLFFLQLATFLATTLLLCISMWIGYGNRI